MSDQKNYLVTGANRGLGLEFTKQILGVGHNVYAACRNITDIDELQLLSEEHQEKLIVVKLDINNHDSILELNELLKDIVIDVMINNAGTIGPLPYFENTHKQHFGSIDYDVWSDVLKTNLYGPVKMAETFLEQIKKGHDKKMIFISSVVGSIADDHQRAFAYATSKTALNKSVALLADILKDQEIKVLAMCPGYVKTRMNGGGANLEPEESIAGMLKQIERLDHESSGTFVRYNGEKINW
ncbi:MAG: short-chain dehydrogenase [Gammaproteobacteria bacterium]|jgi:NAD(P)-dependent dehydrogenase (short-subunit alcohol dehydrogenase family)|nr:short-chain dehydrogenase [Gammaproteobacteria bacterium]